MEKSRKIIFKNESPNIFNLAPRSIASSSSQLIYQAQKRKKEKKKNFKEPCTIVAKVPSRSKSNESNLKGVGRYVGRGWCRWRKMSEIH